MISENIVKSQGGGYEGRGGNLVEYGIWLSYSMQCVFDIQLIDL